MLKKMLIGGALVLVAGTVLVMAGGYSYLRTSAGIVEEQVKSNIPLGFQIQRARDMIGDLKPVIRRNMEAIAKEQVEVERLGKRIDGMETELAGDKGEILRLQKDVASGQEVFHYAGRQYDVTQVKADLENRFQRFKTSEATLKSLEEIHAARSRGLSAARQKLEGMLAAKRQLEVDVENLEARRQMIEAAQTTSEYTFDEGQLGQVQSLIDDLETRLEVTQRLVHADDYYHDEIPLDESPSDDIVDRVAEYFGADATPKADSVAASE